MLRLECLQPSALVPCAMINMWLEIEKRRGERKRARKLDGCQEDSG